MADKYLIHGATYCGDGTTSAEAASNGAAGAWNNINVLEDTAPAYGSLAAGDTVYIRSKSAAGADITRTAAPTTVGKNGASASSWVTWVLDGGTVWSGINGTLTYESPSYNGVYLCPYNLYRSEIPGKFVIKETNTGADDKNLIFLPGSNSTLQLDGVFIDASATTTVGGNKFNFPETCDLILSRCRIKWARHYSPIMGLTNSTVKINDSTIELTTAEPNSPMFNVRYGAAVEISGGRVFGTGAIETSAMFGLFADSGPVQVVGTIIPRELNVSFTVPSRGSAKVAIIGGDGGAGASIAGPFGYADSRSDGNYPTLDTYINSSPAVPWTWKIYPKNAGVGVEGALTCSMLFTDTAAAKTITAHVLIASTNTSVNKRSLWLDVNYIDNTTGLPVACTTYLPAGGSLATDTAAWSAVTYGATSLLKRKLEVTTPSSIKPNTLVTCVLRIAAKAASPTDIIFFDPAVGIA